MRIIAAVLLVAVTSSLLAQQISGRGTFPQYRSNSGLPGSGYGLNREGRFTIDGAASQSTPIAYSLGPRNYVFSLANLSPDKRIRSLDGDQGDGSNGTGVEGLGLETPLGNATVNLMYLSKRGDAAVNVHWQVKRRAFALRDGTIPVDLGFGVQDLLSQGGSSGEELDRENGGGKSNSSYAVLTAELPNRTYVSGGVGVARFSKVFANASGPVGRSARWTAEFDGFGLNVGAVVQVAPQIMTSVALMDNRRLQWTATLKLP